MASWWSRREDRRRQKEQEERDRRKAKAAVSQARWTRNLAVLTLLLVAVGILGVWLERFADDAPSIEAAIEEQRPPETTSTGFIVELPNFAPGFVVEDLSAIGTPPEFTVDDNTQEAHCSEWESWLDEVDAAYWGGSHEFAVAAPTETAVVIVDVEFEIYDHRPVDGTSQVQCQYGAGGHYATTGLFNLESGAPVLELSSDGGTAEAEDFVVPPDSYRVEAGITETIELVPQGDDGWWEWSMTVTAIVDQEEVSQRVGSPENPILTFKHSPESDELPRFDWDIASCSWTAPPYGDPDYKTTLPSWTC